MKDFPQEVMEDTCLESVKTRVQIPVPARKRKGRKERK
jgi:hypothetical protein